MWGVLISWGLLAVAFYVTTQAVPGIRVTGGGAALLGAVGAGGRLPEDELTAFGAGAGVTVAAAGCRRRPPQPVTKYCWMIATVLETNQYRPRPAGVMIAK